MSPAGDPGTEILLDRFLGTIEGRAVRMAALALGDREAALDAVQDTMMRLIARYADRPEAEWAPLFWRILQSRIADSRRRLGVRRRVVSLLGLRPQEFDTTPEIHTPDDYPDLHTPGPDQVLADSDFARSLEQALAELPLRQQQAFLLRVWEGLDTPGTARALGISEGTVKTHLHRAIAVLRSRLEDHR